MDLQLVKQLIETVSQSNLTNFEVETEGLHIKMEKRQEQIVYTSENIKNNDASRQVSEVKINNEGIKVAESSMDKNENNKVSIDEVVVTSPIVGTFYGASSTGGKPFVQEGTKVKKGDVLCIIEAMKLMNEIEAEVSGEIVQVMVENEAMVEYGQALFKIRKEN